MKALRFDTFGSPDVLRCETLDDPQANTEQAVVTVRAASINPSDVSNVAGRFSQTTLPRTPGRDYSGVVSAGPEAWLGQDVWGSGDGGFRRDGSHAERIAVPVASLRHKPSTLSYEQAASIGVTFLAAWIGAIEYAQLKAGETLVVIGAAGGVGGAAVQIAHRAGARIIGIDRTAPSPGSPAAKFAESVVAAEPASAAAIVRQMTEGRGADVVLNAVGGATFEPSLNMLAHRGRLAVLASPGQRSQTFDLLDFYHNESQLLGVDTLKRDMIASALVLEALSAGFEDGTFEPPIINDVVPLERAVDGYRAVAAGSRGRVVIAPASA
jgi:NADPH:quinone reductase